LHDSAPIAGSAHHEQLDVAKLRVPLAADLHEEGVEVDVNDSRRHGVPWYLRPYPDVSDKEFLMISPTMQDAFNEQMKHEFYSCYLYLSMSAYCENANLPGLARWMRQQAREEAKHAMKIFDHLLDRNGRPSLRPIDKPPSEFQSARDVFEQAHKHEQQVTASINHVYGLASDERDFASRVFLDWFVQEQVEEEKTSGLLAEQLRMVGDDRPGLLMLDRELGQRRGGGDEGAGEAPKT
jgi:ferritin